jgi:hypothetical protein
MMHWILIRYTLNKELSYWLLQGVTDSALFSYGHIHRATTNHKIRTAKKMRTAPNNRSDQ